MSGYGYYSSGNGSEVPRPALRRNSQSDKRVDEWYGTGAGDLEQRLNTYNPLPRGSQPRYTPTSPSISSSMGQSVNSSAGSTQVPSLSSSRSTRRSSITSARTSYAGSVLGPSQNLLREGEDGVLEAPPVQQMATWQCPFTFLGCNVSFVDIRQWDTHCQAHFRMQLPRYIECPFAGCAWSYTGESGAETWRSRWEHVWTEHGNGGVVEPRATRSMIDHLWRSRLVSDAQEQELRSVNMLLR